MQKLKFETFINHFRKINRSIMVLNCRSGFGFRDSENFDIVENYGQVYDCNVVLETIKTLTLQPQSQL